MTVVEFRNVHRAYRHRNYVLHGVSFEVVAGEVVGLLGKNGAGKTTLLRLALGLIEPQLGEVRVFGTDPRRNARDVKRHIGYVAEDQSLPPFLRVDEVLNLHRTLYPDWEDGLARQLAGQFRLPARAKIAQLSKGQARQVALLCAVAHRPELLLLDEPAGGLDPAARREFLETAIRILNEAGSTVIFSSHHLTDVERIARRVVMIHDGYLYLDSEVDDLREGYSLALIPPRAVAEPIRLLDLPDCVGVRPRSDSLHAIFRRDPASTRALLNQELDVDQIHCASIALEEMFVELVGSFEPATGGQGSFEPVSHESGGGVPIKRESVGEHVAGGRP